MISSGSAPIILITWPWWTKKQVLSISSATSTECKLSLSNSVTDCCWQRKMQFQAAEKCKTLLWLELLFCPIFYFPIPVCRNTWDTLHSKIPVNLVKSGCCRDFQNPRIGLSSSPPEEGDRLWDCEQEALLKISSSSVGGHTDTQHFKEFKDFKDLFPTS